MAEVTKFRFGNTYPDDLYAGNSLVDRVYYGSELVYGFAPPIQIELVEVISFVNNTGGNIPNYVDDTYFAVLSELAYNTISITTPPTGWNILAQNLSLQFKLTASYKILSVSDRGTAVGYTDGSNVDYDQLYIFKKVSNKQILSISSGNFGFVNTNTTITINAPILEPDQAGISFYYGYSNSPNSETVSNPTSDQTIYHDTLNYIAGQYTIWDSLSSPVNTEYGINDGISQMAFWIIVE